MALVLKDRVLENSLSTGTGAFTLAGPQVGYQSFSVIGNGNTTYYTIQGKYSNGNLNGEWEVGVGTWSTGNILSRDIVLESSNNNNLVVFSVGDKDVFCDLPAEKVSPTDVLGTMAYQNANAVNITGGIVDVDAGTAALPTLGTTGDPNTGIFFPAADTVAVATNGAERMRITSTGNVTIGTTTVYSSVARLTVTGGGIFGDYISPTSATVPPTGLYAPSANVLGFATNTTNALTIDASQQVGIGVTPSYRFQVQSPGTGAVVSLARFGVTGNGGAGRGTGILIGAAGSASSVDVAQIIGYQNASSATANSAALAFQVADSSTTTLTERMRIDSAGNLGLGVTPSAWGTTDSIRALQLSGGAFYVYGANRTYQGQNVYLASGGIETYVATAAASTYRQFNGAHSWFNAPSGTANTGITFTQAMTLNASGNLGIGTASPSTVYARTLHIASPAATSAAGVVYTDTQSAKTYAVGINSGFFQWYDVTAATERMRLDTNGNLLVGTTSIAGVASNNKVITNGGVLTNSGNLSVATATPTTIFSITAANRGRYEVVAMVLGSGIPLGYTAIATVIWDGSGGRVVANNGTNLTITLSGSDVQVTQTAGSSQIIYWSFQRLALF
jgi:hypothetical protein